MKAARVFGPQWLAQQLSTLPQPTRWIVAFSGGGDSLALLHALANGGSAGHELLAVHVHHGLQQEADGWAETCAAQCARLGVRLIVQKVQVNPDTGGPEAAARMSRYTALRSVLGPGDMLLTAHHADDQAETLLLQLLRGSGPAGLAAMPAISSFGEGWHARPLLATRRAALQAYLEQEGLEWIDDPSNADVALSRNYLRHKVMPLIEARWPALVDTLGRAAGLQAESRELLATLGRQDLASAACSDPAALCVTVLRTMPEHRMRNVIRTWLYDRGLPLPSAKRLSSLPRLLSARWDAQAVLRWPGAELRRYRDSLYATPSLPQHDPTQILSWDLQQPLALPGQVEPLTPAALRSDVSGLKSSGAHFTIRYRRGGERCRLTPRGRNRALKSLLQEAGVPPWLRDRIPLLYADDRLVEVVGYWACCAD
ncbi:tRNA lysidine(34) synthetase TilS [Acidihalobacter aeolianus]|uniref:tRNA lysidine(34) synthetase TilS n=1 Tax=Acidihalobacter aeolianus TaxID=2792603 RepID=UPI0009F1E0F9|nr:tRNA lysidine(34) synthetase TilS [Acidihalobacter aeolianus]